MHVLILIGEDTQTDAVILVGKLKKYATFTFDTLIVDSVEGIKARAQERAFDIVLLDLNLTDSTGARTFDTVQALLPETPIVVITGRADSEGVERIKYEADGFISKDLLTGERLNYAINFAFKSRQRLNEVKQVAQKYESEIASIRRELATSG